MERKSKRQSKEPVIIKIGKPQKYKYYPENNLHPLEVVDWVNKVYKDDLVIYTFSDHLVNQIRYLSYKKEIHSVDIQYDKVKLKIIDGHFYDMENNKMDFPSGFFDATLSQLLEIA